jgi:hypothetical protein
LLKSNLNSSFINLSQDNILRIDPGEVAQCRPKLRYFGIHVQDEAIFDGNRTILANHCKQNRLFGPWILRFWILQFNLHVISILAEFSIGRGNER